MPSTLRRRRLRRYGQQGGGRLMLRRFVITCTTVALAVIFVSAADAAQPVATPFSGTVTSIVTDLCAFPVTVQGTVNGTLTFFTNATGTRASFRGTEQDVLSANGKSLTGLPYVAEV